MNKKAQLQMQETMLVIFVFIVIVGIGLILFNQFNNQSIKQIAQDDQLTYFYSLIGTFPNMPEVKCSYLSDDKECIDVYKLLAFKNKGDFLFSNITIYTVYPKKDKQECNLQILTQGQNCGTFLVYNNIPAKCKTQFCEKKVIYSPVSLYYPDKDSYDLGKLVIEVYL
ncbi:MAG: hypothetical protein PHF86_10815 [Candidatus Nanoarchaeia archaeon]|nr:hypothetical protein [Candidatus Nanoarchaeia archaeon]